MRGKTKADSLAWPATTIITFKIIITFLKNKYFLSTSVYVRTYIILWASFFFCDKTLTKGYLTYELQSINSLTGYSSSSK